jgi:RimJ/RimL family protein N-acetyltransferase
VSDAWPLFDLRIRTARLELRSPTDADLMALVQVALRGVHDPTVMPFAFAWTDLASPEFERSFLRYMWGTRASWTPDDWKLPLAVVHAGKPIGVQELAAAAFASRRAVETGSWLGATSQGQGFGTEMRAAALHLAFDGLGATSAHSGALEGNDASRRVSEKLGYAPNGVGVLSPRGRPVEQQRYLLRREDWHAELYPGTIEYLDVCRSMFGAEP